MRDSVSFGYVHIHLCPFSRTGTTATWQSDDMKNEGRTEGAMFVNEKEDVAMLEARDALKRR